MTRQLLRLSENRGLHQIIMDNGPNALDRPMMAALRKEIAELAAAGAPALLLASAHPTVFCPGWDLIELVDATREEVGAFLAEFNRLVLDLFSYPGPTAAAIGGHAVAGGCLFAHACDLRVMATGKARLGLSELNLGVPVPGNSLRMLSARLSSAAVDHLVFRGEGCTADRAREFGIIHRTAAADDVVNVSGIELGKLAGRPRRAFSETKRMLLGSVWQAMATDWPAEDEAFLDCWFDGDTQERLKGVASRLRQ
jgi:enoyl-CoA hydratase